jgi:hypothetical protein
LMIIGNPQAIILQIPAGNDGVLGEWGNGEMVDWGDGGMGWWRDGKNGHWSLDIGHWEELKRTND